MKVKIEKPKVFISYAWGTPEYQNKVIEFAQSLTSFGIDVELDKWSLKEGNDTYAFMEQSVQNPEITNVLILLDKIILIRQINELVVLALRHKSFHQKYTIKQNRKNLFLLFLNAVKMVIYANQLT